MLALLPAALLTLTSCSSKQVAQVKWLPELDVEHRLKGGLCLV